MVCFSLGENVVIKRWLNKQCIIIPFGRRFFRDVCDKCPSVKVRFGDRRERINYLKRKYREYIRAGIV